MLYNNARKISGIGEFMHKNSMAIKVKETIKHHIINNKKEYIIVVLIFVVGIFFGVLFVNNMKENQVENNKIYISNFVNEMKNTDNINSINVLKSSIKQNALIALGVWFFGTTVIRNTCGVRNCFI